MKIINYTAVLFFLLIACKNATSQDSQEITDFDIAKHTDAILVDVRTPEEFADGHLPDAKNINLFDEDFTARFAEFNKKTTIYVYCRSGGRSARAQKILRETGFSKVVNLEGGFLAWKSAGKVVEE